MLLHSSSQIGPDIGVSLHHAPDLFGSDGVRLPALVMLRAAERPRQVSGNSVMGELMERAGVACTATADSQ